MALPPQALILQSGTDSLHPVDSFHTWRESTDPTISNSLAYFTAVQAEAERLLDISTPANRDFVDERLGKIRLRKQDLEARLADLERVEYEPVDLEAATADALAYLAKFREVPQEGTLEQRKEFLRGFVAEIAIDPDAARGAITFYELPVSSLMSMPGAGVEPA